jgi:putative oxidoreductase
MKIATLIARLLLGPIFVFFGSNAFLHFLPMITPPGTAGQFLTAIFVSHYVYVIGGLQVLGGLLLLVNRYVPLALVLLGPVIVNIFFYHLLMDRLGIPLALIVIILWFILFFRYRQNFSGIFVQRVGKPHSAQ